MKDYDLLKRENEILKQENKLLRGEVLKRIEKMDKEPLLELLDLQRQRIDNLEREYDNLYFDYDKLINNKNTLNQSVNAQVPGELQAKLEQSELKCKAL